MALFPNFFEHRSLAHAVVGVINRISGNSDMAADPTITAGTGAPSATEPHGSAYQRVAAASNGGLYQYRNSGWRRLLDALTSIADHPATACTGAAVAAHSDHSATPCTGSAVADHGATTPAGSADSGTASITMGGSTAGDGTGATGSSTASITTSPEWVRQDYTNPNSGVNIIPQKAADFDEITWTNITQPLNPGNVQVVFSATWDGGDIEISGLQSGPGDDGVETITANPGATVESTHGYTVIRRIRNTGTRTNGTVDVQTGPKLAILLGGRTATLSEVYETSAHGRDTGASVGATGLVTVTEAPDGAHDYIVVYKAANTASDAGHTHTGPSHTHGATGLTATDAGHQHGMTGVTVTPPAHSVTQPSIPTLTHSAHSVTQPSTPILTHSITP